MGQEIKEIIQKIKGSLSNWPTDKRIDIFLEMIYKEYNLMLYEFSERNSNNSLPKQHLQTIELVEQRILQSLKDYFCGNLYGAIGEVDMLLQDINHIGGYNITIIERDNIWYRGRLRENGTSLYKRNEMFHIPEYLREKVNGQRFSFNGYPCLYLGKSIWTCWEELDEPHLDDICFSAFKLVEDIKLLDLSIPSEESMRTKSHEDFNKLLITLPVAIACSVKTKNENANFKEEYIVPQLMMVNLINSRRFEGFIYSSTKKNPALNWKEDYLLNIVLPVMGDFDIDGLSIGLKQQFSITLPIYYRYEFLKSNISNLVFADNEDIDMIFNKSILTNEREATSTSEDLYPRALFGQMETILKNKEFSKL